jgi:hypothetical protein
MTATQASGWEVKSHISKPGYMDLSLIAALKSVIEPTDDINDFRRIFEDFCKTFKPRNNYKPANCYSFIVLGSYKQAEVVKLHLNGDVDCLLATISLIEKEAI